MYIEIREYKVAANAFNFLIIERLVEGNWIEVQDKYFFRDAMYRTRAKGMMSQYTTFRTAGATHIQEYKTYAQRPKYKYIQPGYDGSHFVEKICVTVFETELEILMAKQEMEAGLFLPKPPTHMLPASERNECEQVSSLHTSVSGIVTVDVISKS